MTNLPALAQERNITAEKWSTLKGVLYPDASDKMIALVIDYCKSKEWDVMAKPVYILSFNGKEQIVPSIAQYRTTAARTGNYGGIDAPVYEIESNTIIACHVTVYRIIGGQRCAFVGSCYSEMQKQTTTWKQMPRRMYAIRAERDALRKAFPEELGSEATFEELDAMQKEAQDAVELCTQEQQYVIDAMFLEASEITRSFYEEKYGKEKLIPAKVYSTVLKQLKTAVARHKEKLLEQEASDENY